MMSHTGTHLAVRKTRSRGRVVTIALAATAAGVAWLLGKLARVDYITETPIGARQITLSLTVASTVVAGVAGWAIIALLERYSASPQRIWIRLTLVVLVLSIVPIFWTSANLSTQLMLTALHCVAAAILIPALPQWQITAARRK
jgi:hypothetical protein